MPSPLDLAVVIQQTPLVQKASQGERDKASSFRSVLTPYVSKEQAKDRDKVAEVQKKEHSRAVDREVNDQENSPKGHYFRRQQDESYEEEDGQIASNASPWSGNIINVKI